MSTKWSWLIILGWQALSSFLTDPTREFCGFWHFFLVFPVAVPGQDAFDHFDARLFLPHGALLCIALCTSACAPIGGVRGELNVWLQGFKLHNMSWLEPQKSCVCRRQSLQLQALEALFFFQFFSAISWHCQDLLFTKFLTFFRPITHLFDNGKF